MSDTPGLSSDPASAIPTQEPARRLWELWRQGQKPDVRQYLHEAGALSSEEVLAVLYVDQRERWAAGERVPAETYVQDFSFLQTDDEALMDLAFAEYLIRERLGEAPESAEYPQRFPRIAESLRQQIAFNQAVQPTHPEVSGDRASDATVSQAQAADTTDLCKFLAPAQAPGEIGRLGPYRVLAVLGVGGMGVVFLAEDPQLGRRLALKVMKPGLAASAEAQQRFLREARAMAALKHDHLVTIHQVGADRGVPYLAMELLKGESLEDRLRGGAPLPAADVLRIGREAALGLAAAHRRGLIHRDIKPANIWLEQEGEGGTMKDEIDSGGPRDLSLKLSVASYRVKLLDFGLARAADDPTQLTQQGTIAGTSAYMAPEQGRGDPVDARCDLFSLGCVLYRLCTGRLPFCGKDMVSTLLSVANDPTVPPRERNGAVLPALSDLVTRLLEKKPNDRPASANEVAQALLRIEHTLASGVASAPRVTEGRDELRAQAQARSPRRWFAVAVGALLVFLPLAYFFALMVFRVVTNQGELVIAVDDPNVEVKIVQNGVVVHDKTAKREFTLTAGKGEIEVLEKDGIKLATRQFELTRGGKTTVKVTLQELADARKPKEPQNPKGSAVDDPDRRPADWVLSIGGMIKIRENGKERQTADVGDLPRVTDVDFNFNPKVSDTGLALFKDCKNVSHLALAHTKVSDAGLAYFKDCKNLTLLNLTNTKVSDAGLAHFKDCKRLTDLNLASTQVSDVGLALLKDCKNLTYLNLHNTAVSDAGLAHFQDCKNLTHLDLSAIPVTDAGLAHFTDCKNLRGLYLISTQLSDAGLAHFKDCKNLTHLDLASTKVSDAGLAHFKDCKDLTSLRLRDDAQVSDAGLALFKDCTHLTSLDLGGTQVSDAGLAHFKDRKNLKELSLAETKVSDVGLSHFKDCKGLTYLDLHRTQMSDAGLERLVGCPRLVYLNVKNAKVTEAGVKKLSAALPACRIDWDGKKD